ncbi:unnamed protein product [Absidia cylindrospora]
MSSCGNNSSSRGQFATFSEQYQQSCQFQNYSNDVPGDTTTKPCLQPEQVKPFVSQLNLALQTKSLTDYSATQKQFTKIVKARCYYESGDYDTTLVLLDENFVDPKIQQSGYSSILCLEMIIIKAVCLELTGKVEEALERYKAMIDMIEGTVETTDRTMVDWCEEGLYRGSLLALGHRNLDTVATSSTIHVLLRAYQKITSSQPSHWRTYKRAVITRFSLDYLSSSYRRNEYCPPPLTDQSVEMDDESFKTYAQEMFLAELTHLYAIYEKIVYTLVSFPKSGQTNKMILEMVDRLSEDMDLLGNSPSDLKNYIEILNRATQRTFNSSRITRHLFLALVQLGDFKEAEHALSSYLYLVGLQSQVTNETKNWGDAITIDKHGKASTIPFMNGSLLKQLVDDALSESTLFTYQQKEQEAKPINTPFSRRPSTIASKRTDDKELWNYTGCAYDWCPYVLQVLEQRL